MSPPVGRSARAGSCVRSVIVLKSVSLQHVSSAPTPDGVLMWIVGVVEFAVGVGILTGLPVVGAYVRFTAKGVLHSEGPI